jgi:hypothetical protein
LRPSSSSTINGARLKLVLPLNPRTRVTSSRQIILSNGLLLGYFSTQFSEHLHPEEAATVLVHAHTLTFPTASHHSRLAAESLTAWTTSRTFPPLQWRFSVEHYWRIKACNRTPWPIRRLNRNQCHQVPTSGLRALVTSAQSHVRYLSLFVVLPSNHYSILTPTL